jgi:hypothetical protein
LNYPSYFHDEFPGSMILLSTLITAFPENGLEMYKTLDYWECKDLLDIKGIGSCNPSDRLQLHKNNIFNDYLDSVAYSKFDWQFLPNKYNLFVIKRETENIALSD